MGGSGSAGREARAEAAGITFGPVKSIEGYHEVEALQQAVWAFDALDTVPLHMLLTAQKNGGLLLGAREPGGTLVGFVFGFVGRQENRLRHCSHMAGVLEAWRHLGIGERLKWLQAEAVREQGLDLVTWTFDPLQAPNANLNFHKLGGISRTYTINLYGQMTDSINQGSDSDRLTVEWWLDSERYRRHRLGAEIHPTVEQLIAQGADFAVRAGPDGYPVRHHPQGETALLEVPHDFVALKTENPPQAQAWRAAAREVLVEYFDAGWAVTDFVRRTDATGRQGFFVLRTDASAGLPPRLKV